MMFKFILFILLWLTQWSCTKDQGATGGNSVKDNDASIPDSALQTSLPLSNIHLPKGFHISVFSGKVPGARSLALGSDGTVFVSTHDKAVYALPDRNHNGFADKVIKIADNLNMPNGLAFHNGSLYVGEISRILRYDNIESRLNNPPSPVVVYDKFPTETHHGWKYMEFGPDGKLYVATGAPCNVCEVDYSRYGNIVRMNADGTGWELFAKGLRNSVGFDWQPGTNVMWLTDNGRDNLGDDIPNDELNRAPKVGMHFGFPYCHEGDIQDPDFKTHNCSEFSPPILKLGAHVAALGMRFYTGKQFPLDYKNAIFIAEHGSWNRSQKVGYRVMAVFLNGSSVASYQPFATGWLKGQIEWGRPVDVLVMKDGSLLISDDMAGAVYRVVYKP